MAANLTGLKPLPLFSLEVPERYVFSEKNQQGIFSEHAESYKISCF
jgi:hypothetical protein